MSATLPQVFTQLLPFLPKKRNTRIFLAVGLAGTALLGGVLVVYLLQINSAKKDLKIIDVLEEGSEPFVSAELHASCCTVEVVGAVNKPGIYQVDKGSKIQDVFRLAGGFDTRADAKYITEKIQLLEEVIDGQKLYVPFQNEQLDKNQSAADSEGSVSVNTATRQELIALPVIGEKTADQIISSRPYQSVEDFFTKLSFSEKEESTLKKLINAR